MICKECENTLEVDFETAQITDMSSQGGWVRIQFDWYCPTCEDYKGTQEDYFEAQ